MELYFCVCKNIMPFYPLKHCSVKSVILWYHGFNTIEIKLYVYLKSLSSHISICIIPVNVITLKRDTFLIAPLFLVISL